MKHFVTLAALLTSLSAFAQLPYNPDANNDGHIGAFDLTSLLSVYSGNFSNGVLGEGTLMAAMDSTVFDNGQVKYEFSINGSNANSWVVDLSLVPTSLPQNMLEISASEIPNGTTLTILKPTNWLYDYPVITYASSIDGPDFNGEFYGAFSAPFLGFYAKMVFWNGQWLPSNQFVAYTFTP